jgi:ribonuclease BN (tRNA processing enzyme)
MLFAQSKAILIVTFIIIAAIFPQTAHSRSCSADVSLQVLGSGGPELYDGRTSSSYLIWQKDKAVTLLDAGSGASIQYGLSGAKITDLDVVLLSHLHTDHSADLPAFVKGSYFTPRVKDLWIMGPAGNNTVPDTAEFINRLFGDAGAFTYLSDYLKEGKESYLLKPVNAIPRKEKKFQERFRWGKVIAMGVNHGPIPAVAWKVIINGCTIVYTGDTSNKNQKLAEFASGADLLIAHFAIPEDAGRIAKSLHMSPSQIGEIAQKANPKKLLISHFMRRSERNLQQNLEFIRQRYSGKIVLAEDLLRMTIK